MKHVKILWIDDSEEWALSAQENLDIISAKYKVKFHFINAKNGENIIQQCQSIDLDLVIMDYDMTPYLGHKYIHEIRNHDHLDSIKIVFYSQNNSINLDNLVLNLKNVTTVYRPNLDDKIKEIFSLS